MKWTRKKVEAAKDYDVLRGCRGSQCIPHPVDTGDSLPRCVHEGPPNVSAWCIFEVDGASFDVHEKVREMGLIDEHEALDFSPQRDDDVAPANYDDDDAAVGALNAGYTLIKLPDDIGSKYSRLYVLDNWEPMEDPAGWFVATKVMKPSLVSKALQAKMAVAGAKLRTKRKADLALIKRHRRRLGQPPLDPLEAGWTLEDIELEAQRIRALPKSNRGRRRKTKAKPRRNPAARARSIMRRFMRL